MQCLRSLSRNRFICYTKNYFQLFLQKVPKKQAVRFEIHKLPNENNTYNNNSGFLNL